MSFADRFMHTVESLFAFPFAFVFGYDNSPEPQWHDPPEPEQQPTHNAREAEASVPQQQAAAAIPAPAPVPDVAAAAPEPVISTTREAASPGEAAPPVPQAPTTTPPVPAPAPEVDLAAREPNYAARRLDEQRYQHTQLQERLAWEKAYYDTQEKLQAQTRAASLRGLPDDIQDLITARLKAMEAERQERAPELDRGR